MENKDCTHNHDQIIWIAEDNKVYSQCTHCNLIFNLTVNYDTDKFTTNVKPTNHQKKIFDITELESGKYLYERK